MKLLKLSKIMATLVLTLTLSGCDPITLAVVGPTVGALGGMAVGSGINAVMKPDDSDSEIVVPKD